MLNSTVLAAELFPAAKWLNIKDENICTKFIVCSPEMSEPEPKKQWFQYLNVFLYWICRFRTSSGCHTCWQCSEWARTITGIWMWPFFKHYSKVRIWIWSKCPDPNQTALMSLKMCHASFRLITPHDILKKYLRNPFKPSLAKKSELKCTETVSESTTLDIHLIFWPWWVIILVYQLCPDFPSIWVIKPHYLGAFLLSQLM